MNRKKRIARAIWASLLAGLVVLGILFGPDVYHVVRLLLRLQDNSPNIKYNASNENNLKALYTAFKEYHESEGQFPDSAKWMDEVKPRIKLDNMDASESAKKLINPLYPAKNGVYGYAMNDAANAKYRGDLKPTTILIFDSSHTGWNAHGDPAKLKPKGDGGDEGITVEGKIVKLP